MDVIWRWFWTLVIGNPLVVRIVHGASRRQPHFWIRAGYLGLLLCLVVFNLLFGGFAGAPSLVEIAKAGTAVFGLISYGQVILVCLLAPLFMAGAISAEQSGKTFDILLTTPMSNLQVVLGSLLGRLFFIWSLLLSGLPFFSVLLVFGGVPVSSVFVSFAVAALAALVVGSVAVALSVTRRGGRKAIFVFIVTVAAYLVGCYLIDVSLLRGSSVPDTSAGEVLTGGPCEPGRTTWLTALHPLLVLEASINTANYRPPAPEAVAGYWWPLRIFLGQPFVAFLLMSIFGSAVLVIFSAVCLRIFGQGEMTAYWQRMIGRGESAPSSGDEPISEAPRKHSARPARTVWTNPIAWREASTRGGGNVGMLGRIAFVVIGLSAALVVIFMLHTGRLADKKNTVVHAPTLQTRTAAPGTTTSPAVPVVTSPATPPEAGLRFIQIIVNLVWVEIAVITLIAVYMSAGAVSKEREDGTLDLILTTPITPKYYVWGKLRGLVSFLSVMISVPVLTVAMASAYSAFAGNAGMMERTFSGGKQLFPIVFPEAPLLVALNLIPFIAACVMLGMFLSIKSRGVMPAIATSVGVLSVVVLTLGFCGVFSAKGIPLFGTVINSMSPTTGIQMAIEPWDRVAKFEEEIGPGRTSMMFGSLASAATYGACVLSALSVMVSSFDFTVRKSSGQAA